MIDNRIPDAPRTRTTREGFALPMTILIIAFLTVTIAAAYAATTSEVTTNLAQRGESRAYMIAQAGLENFMARRNEVVSGVPFCAQCGAPPATTYESTTVILPGGKAYVVAQQVRTATSTAPAIYLLRSRGIDTVSVVSGSAFRSGALARAERTVAMLVYWNVNQVNVLSGWTSGSGMNYQGAAGSVSGVDECGLKGTVAGVAVPTGGFSTTPNGNMPEGSPAVSPLGTTRDALQAAMKIDWNGIVNGTRIQPDFTFSTQPTAAQWNDLAVRWAADPNFYPVIRVNGDLSINTLSGMTGGRGTLIVLGDLSLNGSQMWDGILLVGGVMTSNGTGTVSGATESGLNVLLTPTQLNAAQTLSSSTLDATPGPAIANGTKAFTYNSCEVAKAAGGLASYSVYSNAWMDNFTTY